MPYVPTPAAGSDGAARPFEWQGRAGPFTVQVPPDVFTPSRTSAVLAGALEISPGDTVLDVGCGSGVLSLVAARLGAARTGGCDASGAGVRCAEANARLLGLAEATEFRVGDLLEPVRDVAADVVIADVSGVPDPIARATGWFPDGRAGGPTGSELPVALLDQLGRLPSPPGRAYLPTGTIQAQERVLAAARQVFVRMRPVAEREFPLPQQVTRDPEVAALISGGVLALRERGSRYSWKLTVWCCEPG